MEGFGHGAHDRQRSVLLVEDDPGDTLMIREALETYAPHTDVRAVGDGVEALRYLRREDEFAETPRPDLVLLDLNMPDAHGFDVVQQLRALPYPPRVAAMTGYGQEGDRQRTLDAGFDAHLTKPVSMEQLRRLIEETTVS